MTLVYKNADTNATWTLDTDKSAVLTFLDDKGTATYDLSYDDGIVDLKVYDSSNTAVIDKTYNLATICEENGVKEYNTTGKYAIEFAGKFMDIRNVSITAPVADLALVEKIADSDANVTTSVVYQSPQKTDATVIAAAYDVTGALIAVDVKSGSGVIGKVNFDMAKTIQADANKVKFFLIDDLGALTPMCAALEIAVQ